MRMESENDPQTVLQPVLHALLSAAGQRKILYEQYFVYQPMTLRSDVPLPANVHVWSDAVPITGLNAAVRELCVFI